MPKTTKKVPTRKTKKAATKNKKSNKNSKNVNQNVHVNVQAGGGSGGGGSSMPYQQPYQQPQYLPNFVDKRGENVQLTNLLKQVETIGLRMGRMEQQRQANRFDFADIPVKDVGLQTEAPILGQFGMQTEAPVLEQFGMQTDTPVFENIGLQSDIPQYVDIGTGSQENISPMKDIGYKTDSSGIVSFGMNGSDSDSNSLEKLTTVKQASSKKKLLVKKSGFVNPRKLENDYSPALSNLIVNPAPDTTTEPLIDKVKKAAIVEAGDDEVFTNSPKLKRGLLPPIKIPNRRANINTFNTSRLRQSEGDIPMSGNESILGVKNAMLNRRLEFED